MANNEFPPQLVATRRKFIEAGGHTTQSFGFGRIIGQIYSLLYLSPRPMCLDDIVQELGVSKASVSTTIRQLQAWSAVKRVWVKGDRRDFYEAETDFKGVLRNGLLEMLRKKFDTAGNQLAVAETSLQEVLADATNGSREDVAVVVERVRKAKQMHAKLNGLLTNPLLEHLL
jgi:DNA-binding transcriptional regulator GbsR (MarR family)